MACKWAHVYQPHSAMGDLGVVTHNQPTSQGCCGDRMEERMTEVARVPLGENCGIYTYKDALC